MVAFVAFKVGAHDDPLVVRTDREDTDGQEVVALCLEVLVQDHLLALEADEGIDHRRREGVAEHRYATADGIAEALARALVVPPALSTNRHRDVGLFDAVLYLLVHLVLERLQVGELGGDEVVLGAQVGEDLPVVAVHEPVVGVDAGIVVTRDRVGTLGDLGGSGHCTTLPVFLRWMARRVSTMDVGLIPEE